MAEGLKRMFADINVTAEIFYDGHGQLAKVQPALSPYLGKATQGSAIKNALKYFIREAPSFYPFLKQLRQFDVIIIVNSLVPAFMNEFFRDEALRYWLPPIPIVLYDVLYLPTRGPWEKWLREGNPSAGIAQPGNWGLERYDWYLVASVVSECPLPTGPQPYSLVGLNFIHDSLRVEPKKEFIALIDFEIPEHMVERAIQVLACEETKTKYSVLHGRYSLEDIRWHYRHSSIFFLAHRESFGLPICEVQACGSYVFTPYANWCPSHWLKADLAHPGPGTLSRNFVAYNNDKQFLINEIERIKSSYDPYEVLNTFKNIHPQLYRGDLEELKQFVRMVESGKIHSQCHREYSHITCDYIGPFG
jgi:hypothetical protein